MQAELQHSRDTIIWGFTMGLGTMNMCFVAFANARAAMHRIGNILDEPLSATSRSLSRAGIDSSPWTSAACRVNSTGHICEGKHKLLAWVPAGMQANKQGSMGLTWSRYALQQICTSEAVARFFPTWRVRSSSPMYFSPTQSARTPGC